MSDDATREIYESLWGVKLDKDPGLRITNMLDEAVEGTFKGMYIQGEDIVQSDPDTHHVTAGMRNLECMVIQDIFLNETAKYAHVFLPGASFLEKDGTFTNAERRIGRVRKVMSPMAGYGDWEATQLLANALGQNWTYTHPSQIMDEIAATTPSFKGVSFKHLDEAGSLQWPVNDAAPNGTPTMHIGKFVIGKGKFMITEYHATEERSGPRFPLILTTGRILSQYNVGAQTRRTSNSLWHEEDVLEIHPFDAEQRGILDGDLIALESRSGDIALEVEDLGAHAARRRLHDLPPRQDRRQRDHHRLFGLGDQLPRVQGDGRAGAQDEPHVGLAGEVLRGGHRPQAHRGARARGGGVKVDARAAVIASVAKQPRSRALGAGRDCLSRLCFVAPLLAMTEEAR